MIVSSMKCMRSSPRLASSSWSMWIVRTGQPFLASVSAVARPCGGDEIADGLAGEFRLAGKLGEIGGHARAAAGGAGCDDGDQLVAGTRDEELQLAVLVNRSERGHRRGALAVLAQALGPELHVPAREAFEPVGIGHHHGDALAARLARSATASAAPTAAGTSAGGRRSSTGASAAAAPVRMAVDVEAEHGGGQQAHIGEHGKAAADAGVVVEHRNADGRRAARAAHCACRLSPAR